MKIASRLLFVFALAAVLTADAQISNFQHVVVIVQENRTPDNLFQGLCAAPYGACAVPPTAAAPYDIETSNWKTKTGSIQPAPVALANTYDLSHAHSAFNSMCDIVAGDPAHCKMDGAAGIACSPQKGTSCPATPQFKFVDNSTGILNPYLTLATQYGWANYMFQTNQGPSFLAHQFLFGGTSAPSQADDAAGIFAAENPVGSAIVGCIAPVGTTVQVINSSGSEKETIYPCFEHLTMADLLTPQFTWRYYTPTPGSIWTAPNA